MREGLLWGERVAFCLLIGRGVEQVWSIFFSQLTKKATIPTHRMSGNPRTFQEPNATLRFLKEYNWTEKGCSKSTTVEIMGAE